MEKLERLHSEEFRRMTTQHNRTLANQYIEAAAQALADAGSSSDDEVRLRLAGAAILSCAAAVASAQSFRVTKLEGSEPLLVAFLGNGLGWDRNKRAATLKLLSYRVDLPAATCATQKDVGEALRFADALLQESMGWLAEWREHYG